MTNSISLQYIAVTLCTLIAVPPQTVRAQEAEHPTQLNIVIVEGEGAINNLHQRVVREPIVRVEDQNHKPVAGAIVSFLLPEDGAGGTFANGTKLLTVTSDANGLAKASGIKPNNVAGHFSIRVTASSGSATGTGAITLSNVAAGAVAGVAISTKLIIILAASAAAAATGVAVGLTRGGGGTAATSLSPGTPTVVAPH